jgi:hypothetical protein
VSYPSKWPAFEARHGCPVPTLLRAALREAKSVRGAARHLDLNRGTFTRWCCKGGIDAKAEIARAILEEAA